MSAVLRGIGESVGSGPPGCGTAGVPQSCVCSRAGKCHRLDGTRWALGRWGSMDDSQGKFLRPWTPGVFTC